MWLQLYINNITRCLGALYLLYERRQYYQWNTIINCSTFLQVKYLQITRTLNETSVFICNLQCHKLYPCHVSFYKHTIYIQWERYPVSWRRHDFILRAWITTEIIQQYDNKLDKNMNNWLFLELKRLSS